MVVDTLWMRLMLGLTWSYSWSAITTRTVRWLLTGRYPSVSVSIRRCWQSTGLSTARHATDHSTSKTSASLAATPSRSQSLPAVVYVSFESAHLPWPTRLTVNSAIDSWNHLKCMRFSYTKFNKSMLAVASIVMLQLSLPRLVGLLFLPLLRHIVYA